MKLNVALMAALASLTGCSTLNPINPIPKWVPLIGRTPAPSVESVPADPFAAYYWVALLFLIPSVLIIFYSGAKSKWGWGGIAVSVTLISVAQIVPMIAKWAALGVVACAIAGIVYLLWVKFKK